MRQRFLTTALGMMVIGGSLGAQSSRTPLTRGTTAITHVNVIPMTSDTVLRDHTVIIRDGRIATIQRASDVPIGAGVRVIDGTGKYLTPGFTDAHTHLYSDKELPDSLASYELGVMLANGITTARLMIGTPEQLTLRAEVQAGRRAAQIGD